MSYNSGFASPRKSLPPIVHALLLLGAIPILAPSLLMTAIAAKRWGRIPAPMIAFDAVVLLICVAALPRLAPLWLLAGVCCAVLVVWRSWEGKMLKGAFFGYSSLVAFAFVFCGGFSIFGILKTFPVAMISESLKSQAPREVSAYQVGNGMEIPEKLVIVRDPQVDWEDRGMEVTINGRPEVLGAKDKLTVPVQRTFVPLTNGDRKAVVIMQGNPAGPPTVVQGWLSEMDDDTIGTWRYHYANRWGGRTPTQAFAIFHDAKASQVPSETPKEGINKAGIPYLVIAGLFALFAIGKGIGE